MQEHNLHMEVVYLRLEEIGPPLGASTKAPATGQEGAKPSDGRADCTPNGPSKKALTSRAWRVC